MPNISNLVKSIQDIMRKDAGTYGDAQRIEQMAWLFFLKIFDDRETQLELFDDDYKSPLKEKLLGECNLHTIVRLPNGVFNPYTGIRTNLLFFTKGQPTTEVWYYEHPYPPGAKSYNKGKPIRIEEFQPEKDWWGRPDKTGRYSKRKETEQAWRVSIDDIRANGYNLDIKNPHQAEGDQRSVEELLPEYEALLAQIAETRGKLRDELQAALESNQK